MVTTRNTSSRDGEEAAARGGSGEDFADATSVSSESAAGSDDEEEETQTEKGTQSKAEAGKSDKDDDKIENKKSKPAQRQKRPSYDRMVKRFGTVIKLNNKNFLIWRNAIQDVARLMPEVFDYFNGVVTPGDEDFDDHFDQQVTQAMFTTCEMTGELGVSHILVIVKKDAKCVHEIMERLQDHFAKPSMIEDRLRALDTRLNDIKMYHNNVEMLVDGIRKIQADAVLINEPFPDRMLHSALQRATIRHPLYKDVVGAQGSQRFDSLAERLINRQVALDAAPAPTAQARIADSPGHRRVRCYRCQGMGHIARNCPLALSASAPVFHPQTPAAPAQDSA